ncbi:MAG: ribonuclease III [Acidimicrobiales bacterium]|jgi:ribonuclease-3|nr:ribonuclease III [Acidimicrobiales bacterium]
MSSPGSVDHGSISELELRIDHRFADPALLLQALTHRSWCAEHGESSNERLEFLGDAVLGVAVADRAYRRFSDLSEGELAKIRAAVVSAPSLADAARSIGLGDHLRLGKGEDLSGGRDKPSILADALEAVIGAVYLDGGWTAAGALVLDLFDEAILLASEGPGVGDHKTRLQELVARHFGRPPVYRLQDEGPDHDKRFFATVVVAGVVRGSGTGSSKKQAEQDAAREAWEQLSTEIETRGASRQAGG